jgi:hypothetical protein
MRQRRRDTRFMGDLRNGHVQRTALSDGAYRSVNQFAPPQRFHPDLRHCLNPCPVFRSVAAILSLIDSSINKNSGLWEMGFECLSMSGEKACGGVMRRLHSSNEQSFYKRTG